MRPQKIGLKSGPLTTRPTRSPAPLALPPHQPPRASACISIMVRGDAHGSDESPAHEPPMIPDARTRATAAFSLTPRHGTFQLYLRTGIATAMRA